MKHFIFILKTIGVSLPVSALTGFAKAALMPAHHAHVPIEPWMITVPFAVLLSVLAGAIIGGILSVSKKANLWYSSIATICFVSLVLILF